MSPMVMKKVNGSAKADKQAKVVLDDHHSENENYISKLLFPGIPVHYPLRKKILFAKANSSLAAIWDVFQIVLCLVACGMFIVDSYVINYDLKQGLFLGDIIITQFFLVDFLLNTYLYFSLAYFTDVITIIDMVTILPVFISLGTHNSRSNLGFLRFVRVLRLARIFRTFKLLRTVSGVKRQVITLSLTLMCMTFLAAGVIQLLENDIAQLSYQCQYLSAETQWEPSCNSTGIADSLCDCAEHDCVASYEVLTAHSVFHHYSAVLIINLLRLMILEMSLNLLSALL